MRRGCFRLQRYKFLKAIHNQIGKHQSRPHVVSDYKDTNFWKQFTTAVVVRRGDTSLFQTTKIQIFESNSQQLFWVTKTFFRCFRLQRYKFLKAIHNYHQKGNPRLIVVSDYKDTNFWKQFTTTIRKATPDLSLFQTTKIQIFESNSQLPSERQPPTYRCFRLQRYKFLKAIHNL